MAAVMSFENGFIKRSGPITVNNDNHVIMTAFTSVHS